MKTEPYHLTLSFNQILDLVKQLPTAEKARLITALQKTIKPSESEAGERESGKYQDQPQPSAEFDSPADIFKEYME